MQYKTHMVTTLTLATPCLMATDELSTVNVGLVLLGSVLPDIDHPNSYIGRKVPFISIPLNKIFKHRGATHTLWAVLLIWLGMVYLQQHFFPKMYLLHPTFGYWLAFGYFCHLLEDSFSVRGVDWFLPFKRRKLHGRIKKTRNFLKYKTGSRAEKVIFYLMIIILLAEVIAHLVGFFPSETLKYYLNVLQSGLLNIQKLLL